MAASRDEVPAVLGTRRHGGWAQPFEIVQDVSTLGGPSSGVLRLPLHLYSSGLGPGREFNIDDDAECCELYEIVLTRGTAEDLKRYINAGHFSRLWPRLWLPAHVRAAWEQQLPPRAA